MQWWLQWILENPRGIQPASSRHFALDTAHNSSQLRSTNLFGPQNVGFLVDKPGGLGRQPPTADVFSMQPSCHVPSPIFGSWKLEDSSELGRAVWPETAQKLKRFKDFRDGPPLYWAHPIFHLFSPASTNLIGFCPAKIGHSRHRWGKQADARFKRH